MSGEYAVKCAEVPVFAGTYRWSPERNVFKHTKSNLFLVRHTDGRWGIGDGKTYLALSKDKPELPTDAKSWTYLISDNVHWYPMNLTVTNVPKTAASSSNSGRAAQPNPSKSPLADDVNLRHAAASRPTTGNSTHQSGTSAATAGSYQSVTNHDQRQNSPYLERAIDWERHKTGRYYNKVTGKWLEGVPVIVCNVGKHTFQCGEFAMGLYAPLNAEDDARRGLVKKYHAADWTESEPLWSATVEVLEEELVRLHSELDTWEAATQGMKSELQAHEDTLTRRRAELQQLQEKEAFAHLRSVTMTSRRGKVHVKRGDNGDDPSAQFPTGEQIRAKYAAAFGDSFEELAGYAVSFIEDTFRAKDAHEVFMYEIMVPLFRHTRAFALQLIQDKYDKLAEAFGLPAWSEQQPDEDGDNLTMEFFLATQQEPLIRAAAMVSGSAVREIVRLMGAKAETLCSALPAWAARNKCAVTFDLVQLVRTLVWVNTAMELSDPKCYLHPPVAHAYKHIDDKNSYKEIFSPGIKKYGVLKAESEVQVVVPGLYFECPTEVAAPSTEAEDPSAQPQGVNASTALPVVPVRVRRLQGASFREISVTASVDVEEQEVEGLRQQMKRVVEIGNQRG